MAEVTAPHSMVSTPTFDDVIALSRQIRDLEKQLEVIKAQLLPQVRDAGGRLQYNGFAFRLGQKVTYTYSEQFGLAKKQLARMKKDEEVNGIAQIKQRTEFLAVQELVQRRRDSI